MSEEEALITRRKALQGAGTAAATVAALTLGVNPVKAQDGSDIAYIAEIGTGGSDKTIGLIDDEGNRLTDYELDGHQFGSSRSSTDIEGHTDEGYVAVGGDASNQLTVFTIDSTTPVYENNFESDLNASTTGLTFSDEGRYLTSIWMNDDGHASSEINSRVALHDLDEEELNLNFDTVQEDLGAAVDALIIGTDVYMLLSHGVVKTEVGADLGLGEYELFSDDYDESTVQDGGIYAGTITAENVVYLHSPDEETSYLVRRSIHDLEDKEEIEVTTESLSFNDVSTRVNLPLASNVSGTQLMFNDQESDLIIGYTVDWGGDDVSSEWSESTDIDHLKYDRYAAESAVTDSSDSITATDFSLDDGSVVTDLDQTADVAAPFNDVIVEDPPSEWPNFADQSFIGKFVMVVTDQTIIAIITLTILGGAASYISKQAVPGVGLMIAGMIALWAIGWLPAGVVLAGLPLAVLIILKSLQAAVNGRREPPG